MTSKIEFNRVSGALGAEVSGVDLTKDLSTSEEAQLQAALLDHQVLFFRDQHLGPEDHIRISRLYGDLLVLPYIRHVDGYPHLIPIMRGAEEKQKKPLAGLWHADMTYYEAPPKISALHSIDVPPYGGDTMWSNTYLAYEALSKPMQQLADRLDAVHCAASSFGPKGNMAFNGDKKHMMDIQGDDTALREVIHPVVQVHPLTRRRVLAVNPTYTTRIVDVPEAESDALLTFFYNQIARHEFTCRFKWSKGSLALWDNRCTQHRAVHDFDGYPRVLHRSTVAGDVPLRVTEMA